MKPIVGAARGYDWGSTERIQRFMGVAVDGEPIAEVWYGAHPDLPSRVANETRTLLDLLEEDSQDALGQFGSLPFLLKVLAPSRSVSLQVHPAPEVAQAGYAEDESAGIARTDPSRRFKDPFHKPEMVFALTRFTGLVGFRNVEDVLDDLSSLRSTLASNMSETLKQSNVTAPDRRRHALAAALYASPAEVDEFAASVRSAALKDAGVTWLAELAAQYPGDPGVAAAILLKRVVLAPGEAIFVPAGMIHAYSDGLAVEVMANSDTVLRAGLTRKLVDIDALLRSVDFDAEATLEVPIESEGRLFVPEAEEFVLWNAEATNTHVDCPLSEVISARNAG
ncbi:mannose-6-phosphate isomerase, class I [Dactylosporangium sp. CA-233914]|uniref:mannose-6-phosphate isomerase, class I n=1 Tax=Dactylosporangium sp. CA-233914 TaxID=3239934 RepID=UPI003D932786